MAKCAVDIASRGTRPTRRPPGAGTPTIGTSNTRQARDQQTAITSSIGAHTGDAHAGQHLTSGAT
jgi:hypothetical protein